MTYDRRTKILATLFGSFDKGDDQKRIAIYSKMLEDVPTELLGKAIKKLILEKKFMPSVSEIVDAAKSLTDSLSNNGIKTWAEAWGEIEKAMYSTEWGKKPEFSRSEIATAVDNYGWNTLQTSLQCDMPTVRAQMRRIYEDVCARSKEQAYNGYVLGNAGLIDQKTRLITKGVTEN